VRTLYRATRVHTSSSPETGEWILVDGRHVERVGSGDPPGADRVVDLPGTTIVPGFVDTHVHLTSTGLSLANEDVRGARSAEDLLEVASTRAAASDQAPVVLLGYDESAWADPRLPSIDELDAACRRPLVVVRTDGHASIVNRAAVEAAALGDLPGVEIDPAGSPTGVLTQRANDAAGLWAMSAIDDRDRQDLQLQAASEAAARGITAVHEMSMPHWHGARDLSVLLGHRARLPVDATPIVASTHLHEAIDHRLAAIGGDLPVDGSVGARTAWLSAPYDDGAGEGASYFADDELAGFFHSGHAAGLQVGVHAIGDAAIEQVLAVWERVYGTLDSRERRHFRARRHRIEHVEMISIDQIERAAMLGLAASVQPAFDARWGLAEGMYERRLGTERAFTMNPVRTMVERGIEVGVGSDAPITPLDPMGAIDALERHHDPSQRLSRREAIRLHTIGSARVGRQDAKKGALAPGMHADLAVFESDPFEAPSIVDLRPVLTVSLGREVFAR
jgi:predicted amidohydrolase YtcJ